MPQETNKSNDQHNREALSKEAIRRALFDLQKDAGTNGTARTIVT